jgi:NMT1/THI5 like
MMNRVTPQRLAVVATVAAVGLAVCVMATAASGSTETHQDDQLMIATAGATPLLMLPYLAVVGGYTKAQGLDVTIKNVGSANVLNLVVAGQADIGETGLATALVPVNQGKDTKIILGLTGHGASAFVSAAKPGITSITQCTRVSSTVQGTAGYTWAALYKYLFKSKYTIVPLSDSTTLLPSILSGSSDCAVSGYPSVAAAVDAGKVHLLIDPAHPATLPARVKPSFNAAAEVGLFGLTSTLKSKRADIVKLLKAINNAYKALLATSTPAQLASLLRQHPDYAALSQDALTTQIAQADFAQYPAKGYLFQDTWKAEFGWLVNGLPFTLPNLKDPIWSYKNRVDMTYYDTANGRPKEAQPKKPAPKKKTK